MITVNKAKETNGKVSEFWISQTFNYFKLSNDIFQIYQNKYVAELESLIWATK